MIPFEENVLYADNHILVVYKTPGLLSQPDKTGEVSIIEKVKAYVKEKFQKPGEVFLGSIHRLDRPAMGLMVFAKTSKALTRMHEKFRTGQIDKYYLAIVEGMPEKEAGKLLHYLYKDREKNQVTAHKKPGPDRKEAILQYRALQSTGKYTLVEVQLATGRSHQIRVQLATLGCPIVGDLKYGARSTTGDRSICLLSHRLFFEHPVTKKAKHFKAAYPGDQKYWDLFHPV